MVSFYVGVPVFDDNPVKAPAAYPLEKEGKPDPEDTVEITINGITQVRCEGAVVPGGMCWWGCGVKLRRNARVVHIMAGKEAK